MKKNFKYILIFIFIVCLLIPISCLNLYAYTYDCYISCSTNNSSTNFWNLYNYIWLNNVDYVVINNVEYQKQYTGFIICQLLARNNSITYEYYLAIYHLNGSNIGTRIAQIYDTKSTDTNNNYLNKIQVYYSSNDATFKNQVFNSNATSTISGYGTQLTKDYTYHCSDYNYFYSRISRTYSGTYNHNIDIQFINQPTSISFDKTYNLSFYNNDILYDSITISGASASGYAPFEEISQIKYGNTIVYDNSVWSSGYNSTLRYNQNMTMPNITQLNIDCDNIVTFYVQLYYVYSEYSQTYNIGTFYNKSQEFNSIQVNGLTIGDNKFSSIDTIYYNDIKVYENNNFINSFDENLYYMYNNININDINNACNNIVIFTKTHIQPTTDDDILYGVGKILTIIKDFANMLLLNKVTIYCCVAIPLLSFAVFIVVKLKNGNDGDNKIN